MKQVLSFFFIIISCTASSQEQVYIDTPQSTYSNPVKDFIALSMADSIVKTAFQYEGVSYRYGGMSFAGMDCSGFICKVFSEFNIIVPHSSYALSKLGDYIGADFLEKGDLIFFKGSSANSVGHVAMVSKIVDGLIYIIHASTSRGVIEEVLQHSDYFMNRWLFNRRLH
jgi:cell wall-associated NlpC family hydrolase